MDEFLYAGQQLDPASGQYYMRARYYDAAAGNFDSRDQYEGRVADPLTLNHYAYAGSDPVINTDPAGTDFSVAETLSVSGIENILNVGIGYVDAAVKAYNLAQNILDLYNYSTKIINLFEAFAQASPQGSAAVLAAGITSTFGAAGASAVLSGFTEALDHIGPHWSDIAKAIRDQSEEIATEVAGEFAGKIGGLVNAQAQGRLKAIVSGPTGISEYTKIKYIDVTSKLQVAVSAGGGSLFGFAFRTSKINVVPIIRLDYWDNRKPFGQKLNIHYHIGGQSHPEDKDWVIWPKSE